jgi:Right handed beta helix region
MNPRFLRRAAFKGLLVATMTLGAVGAVGAVTTSVASAQPNDWYVSPSGHDGGNNCSNSSRPCQTIAHAFAEQVSEAVGGTIHLKAGTYQTQVSVTSASSHVTLTGAGKTSTIEAPATPTSCGTDPDTGSPVYGIICVANGTAKFNVTNTAINGLSGDSSMVCDNEYVGVWYNGASGKVSKVDLTGMDVPANCYGSGSPIGGTGVYVTSAAHAANVSIVQSKITQKLSTTTTRADLPAGSYTHAPLNVRAVPAGFRSGPLLVGGFTFTGKKDNSTNVFITGTAPEAIPSHSIVNFAPFSGAYNKNGIACDDPSTSCTIKNNTITGEGATNGIAQNGILVWGAGNATVSNNTVSGNTYTGGGLGNNGTGIYFLNAEQGSISGNTTSNNDANIYVGLVPLYSGSGLPAYPPSFGTTTVANNTISGATSEGLSSGGQGYGEGIWLDGDNALPPVDGGVQSGVVVQGNTITGSAQAGVFSSGSSGAEVVSNTADLGNEAGMVFAGPSLECAFEDGGTPAPGDPCFIGDPGWGSNGNYIGDNTIGSATPGDGNLAGILMDGYYGNGAEGVSSDPAGSEQNQLVDNVWQGNTLADSVDLSGSPTDASMLGNSYSGNTCLPTPGGSQFADEILGPSVSVPDVTVTSGSPTLTDNDGNFPTTSANPQYPGNVVVTGGLAVDTTSPGNLAGTGIPVQSVSGPTVTLTGNATGSSSPPGDTIGFFNISDCGGG